MNVRRTLGRTAATTVLAALLALPARPMAAETLTVACSSPPRATQAAAVITSLELLSAAWAAGGGAVVKWSYFRRFADLRDFIAGQSPDAVLVDAELYAAISPLLAYTPFMVGVVGGKTEQPLEVVVRSDDSAHGLADLKGRSLTVASSLDDAALDRYLSAAVLEGEVAAASQFFKLERTVDAESALVAVTIGQYDAALVPASRLRAHHERDKLRVLLTSRALPLPLLCLRQQSRQAEEPLRALAALPPELAAHLDRALALDHFALLDNPIPSLGILQAAFAAEPPKPDAPLGPWPALPISPLDLPLAGIEGNLSAPSPSSTPENRL
ncbi:MAG: PhnD/SsuA/transferrin family substrate-binding protein [Candidatus Schekmanbacteria bacterium]|nr:PhnD/SsuA/transferrin family substrate-binding protein [Candidatus Schekmanbacteria bacterium]